MEGGGQQVAGAKFVGRPLVVGMRVQVGLARAARTQGLPPAVFAGRVLRGPEREEVGPRALLGWGPER